MSVVDGEDTPSDVMDVEVADKMLQYIEYMSNTSTDVNLFWTLHACDSEFIEEKIQEIRNQIQRWKQMPNVLSINERLLSSYADGCDVDARFRAECPDVLREFADPVMSTWSVHTAFLYAVTYEDQIIFSVLDYIEKQQSEPDDLEAETIKKYDRLLNSFLETLRARVETRLERNAENAESDMFLSAAEFGDGMAQISARWKHVYINAWIRDLISRVAELQAYKNLPLDDVLPHFANFANITYADARSFWRCCCLCLSWTIPGLKR